MTDIDVPPGGQAIPDWELRAMETYAAEANAERAAIAAEQAQADELEARTLKYSRSLNVVALSSGKYALFLPFSNEDGMPLAVIGTWAELEKPLREYREPERVKVQRKLDAINLDELFGS